MSTKDKEVKEIVLPEELAKKVSKWSFNWVMQDYLDSLVKELTNNDKLVAQRINCIVESHNTTHLVDEYFKLISHDYKGGGFPVLVFEELENGGHELYGFVFIPKNTVDDFCAQGGDMNLMFESTVNTKDDDILFNMMIQLL